MDHAAHSTPTSINRLAFSATVHCLTGCAIGEILGLAIATALGWHDLPSVVLAIVLAFMFGYALTIRPLVADGMPLRQAGRLAVASDTLSITTMEIVDTADRARDPGRDGGRPAGWAVLGKPRARAGHRRSGRLPGQPLADRSGSGPRAGARSPLRPRNRLARLMGGRAGPQRTLSVAPCDPVRQTSKNLEPQRDCRPFAARRSVVSAPQRGTMLESIIAWISNTISSVFTWFQTVLPGGFGLILIPLIILGIITILVSRNR